MTKPRHVLVDGDSREARTPIDLDRLYDAEPDQLVHLGAANAQGFGNLLRRQQQLSINSLLSR